MTTIQMGVGGLAASNPSTLQLPAPSGAVVSVTNGVATVQAADVPTALRAGWTIGSNQPWPAAQVKHLSAPANGNWPLSGSITFPDGTTAAITGPIATLGAVTGGTLYTNGTYTNVPLAGGSGSGALATVVVAGGVVTSVTITSGGSKYLASDTGLSAAAANLGGTGSGFSVPVATLARADVVVPIAWCNQYVGYGFSPTPGAAALDL